MSVKFFFPSLLFIFQGTSSHETQYTYVDHTEARKEEARQRELRRLENDQRQKEFQEKLRQRAEEVERQAGQEKERRQAEYQQQRQREIEQERPGEKKRKKISFVWRANSAFDELSCLTTNLVTRAN